MKKSLSFQDIILRLQAFWAKRGCVILQPYDMEMGAGTFHPATTLWSLGDQPLYAAYVQPSRRPQDGRYGENPNRLQKFHQFQVILKPIPADAQTWVLESFNDLGMRVEENDVRFVEDDWESPSLGAAGLGWEVWFNGMEVLQFTYFQQVGGIACSTISVELTYGLERLAMCIQKQASLFSLHWNDPDSLTPYTWGDLYHQAEKEFSQWYFDEAPLDSLRSEFESVVIQGDDLLKKGLILPAYEMCIRSSHIFNILDARGAVSVAERARYIQRIRQAAHHCCAAWLHQQEANT